MFGHGTGSSDARNADDGLGNTATDYLQAADEAFDEGDRTCALHLYLIAFDKATSSGQLPDAPMIDGLRRAWAIAVEAKDRTLTEHVFERLEPFLGPEETSKYAEELQHLALEKLEDFGISPDALQEMADMVSEDFLGVGGGIAGLSTGALLSRPFTPHLTPSSSGDADASDSSADEDGEDEEFTFKDLVGYDSTVAALRNRGFGLGDDEEFGSFLKMLSERHGIERPQSTETLLFRAWAREDADTFMAATVGEFDLPTVRMHVETSPQGLPVLCVMATKDVKSRLQLSRDGFTSPSVLVLEDIDCWGTPFGTDDMDGFPLSQLSRGAREAIELIRSAVENPLVTVVASAGGEHELEDFFFDMLDPVCVVDIDVPTASERTQVWAHCKTLYPSLRFLESVELVRLSANMSRYDIYMAARESVEQAYRESIERRSYVPVTRENIFDKIAAYQPLESAEYAELQDAEIASLRHALADIDSVDEFLKGEEN